MATPIPYYLSLVPSQYRNSPNFLSWLATTVQAVQAVQQAADEINPAYDIDSAIGTQLDVIGTLVGQSRKVGFQPSGGVSPVLDDTTYRLLLKARIRQNKWDGRIGSMANIWENLFLGGSLIVQDNQNMTMSVIMVGSFTSIIEDLIVNGYIVPRPQGVLCIYNYGLMPFFGVDRDDSYIAGVDVGHAV